MMLEKLHKVIYLILRFTISNIFLGSALYFKSCRLDNITKKTCTYPQTGKNSSNYK